MSINNLKISLIIKDNQANAEPWLFMKTIDYRGDKLLKEIGESPRKINKYDYEKNIERCCDTWTIVEEIKVRSNI